MGFYDDQLFTVLLIAILIFSAWIACYKDIKKVETKTKMKERKKKRKRNEN